MYKYAPISFPEGINFMRQLFKNKSFLLLVFIVLIGSYFRLGGVVSNSFGFTYDVGRDMLAVESLVSTHKPILIGPTTGLQGVFYGPTWYYILSIPFFLSGGNPQALALFIALTGIACIVIAFFVGKHLGGDSLGLFFAALVAISPSLIGISGQIWSPDLVPVFLLLSLLLTFSFLQRGKLSKIGSILLGILIGLLMEMGFIFGLLYVFSFFTVFFLYGMRKKKFNKELLFVLCGVLLTFTPRLIFEFRHQFLMTNSFLRFITGKTPVEKTFTPLEALINRSNVFFNTFTEAIIGNNALIGVLLLIGVVVVYFISFKKIKNSEKQALFFSFSIVAIYFFALTFFPHDIFGHYLIGIHIFFLLILSIAINQVEKRFTYLGIIITVILFLITINPSTVFSQFAPSWEGNAAVYRNQLAVVDYVYANAKNKPFNYIVYTPAVHDYTYRYLFSWYGKNKYGFTPSIKKESQFFVIMEPDFEYPDRLTHWLEVRKDDGKILREEVVKGGIIVQIRDH